MNATLISNVILHSLVVYCAALVMGYQLGFLDKEEVRGIFDSHVARVAIMAGAGYAGTQNMTACIVGMIALYWSLDRQRSRNAQHRPRPPASESAHANGAEIATTPPNKPPSAQLADGPIVFPQLQDRINPPEGGGTLAAASW